MRYNLPMDVYDALASRFKILRKNKRLYYLNYSKLRRALLNILLPIVLYKKIKNKNETFSFQDKRFAYFFHIYNTTWRNERAIEIPIIWNEVKKARNKKILEFGNVLRNYFKITHDVLDKYEIGERVINEDVVTFSPRKKYDLIVSISTLEHVGWDEYPREPLKVVSAINNLRKLIKKNGKMVITFPLNYNSALDLLLHKNQLPLDKIFFLKKISANNTWVETAFSEVKRSKINTPGINTIAIGLIKKK